MLRLIGQVHNATPQTLHKGSGSSLGGGTDEILLHKHTDLNDAVSRQALNWM